MIQPFRRVAAALVAVLLVCADKPAYAAGDPGWLEELNRYRVAAGMGPVTEEPAWTAALLLHLDYLTYTPPQYFVGEYQNLHHENPASPYYTPEGDQAGRSSNLIQGYRGDPKYLIESWLSAPFHAVSMLRPQLTRVALAQHPVSSWAGINVSSGYDYTIPPATTPILFPGPGMSTPITYWRGESPNPLFTCGWQNSYPFGPERGLAMIAMLAQAPVPGASAEIVADNGPDYSTANASICLVDKYTYLSPDPIYGPTGASILESYRAVFLVAAEPLTWSRYHVTLHQPGGPDVTWSFIATPPGQVPWGKALVLHVAEPGVQAVLGNLTVTDPRGAGHTTAYPCLEGRPLASNNNFGEGETIPNFAAVRPDANGDICVFTSADADLIWDQVIESSALAIHNAARLVDTRSGSKPGPGGVVRLHVASPGVATVLGNFTVTEPVADGFTTAYPCLEGRPLASNNNYVRGQTIPNFVAVRPDANGDICLFTTASAHLIWDQVAETTAVSAHNANRIYDTRLPKAY
jgi:hypothetical protein